LQTRNYFKRTVVDLKPYLKGKVLILGVGNSLKQDDGAGPAVIAKLKETGSKFECYDSQTSPENYTGKIKQIAPDTLLIIDAADFKKEPGSIKIFDAENIPITSFSTHNMSLKTMVGFIKADLPDLLVKVIGIQPKQLELGEDLSPEIRKAVEEICTNLV